MKLKLLPSAFVMLSASTALAFKLGEPIRTCLDAHDCLPRSGEAQPVEEIAACREINGNGILQLSRQPSAHTLGVFEYGSLHDLQLNTVPVTIAYTSAGARAIVTIPNMPQLILIGTGSSETEWNGQQWSCFGEF